MTRRLRFALLLFVFALSLSPSAFAQSAKKWEMIPAESSITFHGKQMGSDFAGTFPRFSAEIHFDAADLSASRVTATIDVTSAESGDAERDSNLKSPEWFDIKTFPAARFETTGFRRTDEDSFEANANLTIRDITLPVVLPFTLEITKDDSGKEKAVMKGSLTLDRSKFSLGTGDWADPGIITNEVPVDVIVAATAVQ